MSDDRLRTAYAALLASREPRTRDGCVAPDALLALVQQHGDEDARLRTLDHAMSCAACGRDLALLRTVHAARPRAITRIAGFAVAASILVAAGVVLTARPRHVEPELLRGGNDVSLISPRAGALETVPVRLIWHRVPLATSYDVTILDSDGARAVPRTTTDTTVTLTLGLGASLRVGVDYTWIVTAHLPDNGERRSTASSFRVRVR